jgi:DNA-binding NtrC family response regulator
VSFLYPSLHCVSARKTFRLLAKYFLEQISQRLGRPTPRLTPTTLAELAAYDWPGNIREMQHVIERGIIISQGGTLQIELTSPQKSIRTPTPVQHSPSEIMTDSQMRSVGGGQHRFGAATSERQNLRTSRGRAAPWV